MGSQDQVLSFPLTNTLSRQIFEYQQNDDGMLIMYDSGAQIPVWCSGASVLADFYPEAKKTDYHCEISGFGKETELSDVYVIPEFELSDGMVHFKISNLVIAELFKPFIGCDLLLSETMFSKTDTRTTRRAKRELSISFDKMDRPFICTASMRQKDMVRGITVWSQDE